MNYVNDHIYRMLLSNDRIMKAFKVIWCQKKRDALSDLVLFNRVKVFHYFIDFIFVNRLKVSHHFTIKRSLSKSFLFMKKMNVNELIQFARLFASIFININNSENKLISHTSQSSTPLSSLSFSSTYILQKNISRTQLQIKASSKSQLLYFNYFYLISRDLSSNLVQYMLIIEVFENVESYKSKSYKEAIVNDLFRD